jgi:polyisoprenoid-binding protein YceI
MIAARAALLLACLVAGQAAATDWVVDKKASSLRFTGTAQGEEFDGRFGAFEARIAFDPASLGTAAFNVDIDVGSADTRNEERDGTLKEAEFFDVAAHPKATYVATEFVPVGTGFEAHGTLTLRGVAKPVTLVFTWTADAAGAKLEGKATLDRMAFGVGGGEWADAEMVAHEVKVATTLVLHPAS